MVIDILNVLFIFMFQVCVLSSLRPPISREVYDALVKSVDVGQILSLLQDAPQQKISLAALPSNLTHIDHATRNVNTDANEFCNYVTLKVISSKCCVR